MQRKHEQIESFHRNNNIFSPNHKFTPLIKEIDGTSFIFDNQRKKYVLKTEEEYIRQHFIHFLVNDCHYPSNLIATEISFKKNNIVKRIDIGVFDKKGNIFLLVECKNNNYKLTHKTFKQITTYNDYFKAEYIIVTNGLYFTSRKFDKEKKNYHFFKGIPPYPEKEKPILKELTIEYNPSLKKSYCSQQLAPRYIYNPNQLSLDIDWSIFNTLF